MDFEVSCQFNQVLRFISLKITCSKWNCWEWFCVTKPCVTDKSCSSDWTEAASVALIRTYFSFPNFNWWSQPKNRFPTFRMFIRCAQSHFIMITFLYESVVDCFCHCAIWHYFYIVLQVVLCRMILNYSHWSCAMECHLTLVLPVPDNKIFVIMLNIRLSSAEILSQMTLLNPEHICRSNWN